MEGGTIRVIGMGTIGTIDGRVTNATRALKSIAVRDVKRIPSRMIAWLAFRLERRRSRLALLELTDDQLSDIGISRCDAYREGLRSFYD